jgi:hypothetical protein
MDRIQAFALLIVSAVMMVGSAPNAIRAWQVYAGTGRRRQEDATGRAPLPSEALLERLAGLAGFGYQLIGETRVGLPTGEMFARIVAADDGDSYAIVIDGASDAGSSMGIYSAWPDGQWLGTFHPSGDPLVQPNLRLQVGTGTLGEAIALHRRELERLRRAQGAPRHVARMADMLELDADYRVRFGGRELRPLVVRAILPTLIAAALTALAAVLLVTLPR